MTIAIVNKATGEFLHTAPDGIPVRDSLGVMRPRSVDKSEGWYEFVATQLNPPSGQKPQGSTFIVDHDAGTVTENHLYVDMTADEIKQATNGPLDQQIMALEKQALELGLLRTVMEDLQARFLAAAAAANITEEMLLDSEGAAYSPSYAKLHNNITDRAALRAQRI